jgi:hypothetical protein
MTKKRGTKEESNGETPPPVKIPTITPLMAASTRGCHKTPRRKWDRQVMIKACEEVRAKKMSGRQAAKVYGLPVTTLNDYVNEKYNIMGQEGAPTVIKREEEEIIIELINFMTEIGFCLYNQEVIQVVNNYLKATKQTDLFKNGYPGKEWANGLRKRHKIPSYTDVLTEKQEIMDIWYKKSRNRL